MTTTILTNQIGTIAATFAGISSLAPSVAVNAIFSNLVQLVTTTPSSIAQRVLANPRVQAHASFIRSQSLIGETELEYCWTRYFLSKSKLPWEQLNKFPYFKNYENLTYLEIKALRHYGVDARPVLFVGGGPLPLTACIMAHNYGLQVHVIDNDSQAVSLAKELVQKLGLEHLITISCVDVLQYVPTETVIVLAAMVGTTTDAKRKIHEYLFRVCTSRTTLVCRSVVGLGQLLYTPQPDDSVWTLLECRSGCRDVINTINVYKNTYECPNF